MADDEVRADPVELTRLAAQLLAAAQQIGDGWRHAQGDLAVPAEAFGDTPAAGPVRAEHQSTVDAAEVAIGRLTAVLENDVDALYRVAFAYRQADEAAARKFRHEHPNLPL